VCVRWGGDLASLVNPFSGGACPLRVEDGSAPCEKGDGQGSKGRGGRGESKPSIGLREKRKCLGEEKGQETGPKKKKPCGLFVGQKKRTLMFSARATVYH